MGSFFDVLKTMSYFLSPFLSSLYDYFADF